MISVNLSFEQLVEAVRLLNQEEKSVLIKVLANNDDLLLTESHKQIILQRQAAYNSGNMETYSFDELKSMFKYSEE